MPVGHSHGQAVGDFSDRLLFIYIIIGELINELTQTGPILDEYIRVLAYPKFDLTRTEIRRVIEEELLPFIESVKVIQTMVPEVRDPDDAKFITCAETAGVRWLVSGDDDLLSLRHIQSVEIVSVTAFLQLVNARP